MRPDASHTIDETSSPNQGEGDTTDAAARLTQQLLEERIVNAVTVGTYYGHMIGRVLRPFVGPAIIVAAVAIIIRRRRRS